MAKDHTILVIRKDHANYNFKLSLEAYVYPGVHNIRYPSTEAKTSDFTTLFLH